MAKKLSFEDTLKMIMDGDSKAIYTKGNTQIVVMTKTWNAEPTNNTGHNNKAVSEGQSEKERVSVEKKTKKTKNNLNLQLLNLMNVLRKIQETGLTGICRTNKHVQKEWKSEDKTPKEKHPKFWVCTYTWG